MNNFKEQIQKEAFKTKLNISEFGVLRKRLLLYTKYHPLPEDLINKKVAHNFPPNNLVRLITQITKTKLNVRFLVGVFALIMVVVVVPMVAEQSIPGDTLYLVKIHFNEEIRGTLTLSSDKKVAWETRRIERRIAEARLLASEGKLTDKFEAEVTTAVREHTKAAQDEIDVLKENDAEEAAIAGITLESVLDVQSAVLSDDAKNTTTKDGSSVVALAVAVTEAKETVVTARGTTTPSYQRLYGKVETETTRVAELFESIRLLASVDEVADINRRIKDIHRKLDKANRTKKENEAKAITLLTKVLSDSHKLISFMTDIDVRNSVTVEELVPIELTEIEQLDLLKVTLADAIVAEANLKDGLSNLSEIYSQTFPSEDESEQTLIDEEDVDEEIGKKPRLVTAEDMETIEEELSQGLIKLSDLITLLEAAVGEEDLVSGEEVATEIKELTDKLLPLITSQAEEKDNETQTTSTSTEAGEVEVEVIETKPSTTTEDGITDQST